MRRHPEQNAEGAGDQNERCDVLTMAAETKERKASRPKPWSLARIKLDEFSNHLLWHGLDWERTQKAETRGTLQWRLEHNIITAYEGKEDLSAQKDLQQKLPQTSVRHIRAEAVLALQAGLQNSQRRKLKRVITEPLLAPHSSAKAQKLEEKVLWKDVEGDLYKEAGIS